MNKIFSFGFAFLVFLFPGTKGKAQLPKLNNAFYYSSGIVVDSKGNAFVTGKNNRIIKITPEGKAKLFAGGGRNNKDGKTWTTQIAPWTPRGAATACIHKGKVFMTGGKYGGLSKDGRTKSLKLTASIGSLKKRGSAFYGLGVAKSAGELVTESTWYGKIITCPFGDAVNKALKQAREAAQKEADS